MASNNSQYILLLNSPIACSFLKQGLTIKHRAPRDENNWKEHKIESVSWLFAQPITFTPYISTTHCSACCRFCSENLRAIQKSIIASQLRPNSTYFLGLEKILTELDGLTPILFTFWPRGY